MKPNNHFVLSLVCMALGGLCIGYYSYLCIVYGINEIVFSWVFLLGGMLLLIIGMMTYKRKKHIFSYLPIPLRRIVYLCTTIIIILFLGLQSCILYQGMHTDKQQGDAAIILGAQLHGSSISRLLRYRLERGIQFAEEYPNTYLIVSGGKGQAETCSEASAMKQYLIQHGVAESRILMEDASMNTQENLAFSKVLMKKYHIKSASIITNDFHMFRAGFIATSLGLSYHNYPARSDLGLAPNFYFREFFGSVKDITLSIIKRC